MSVTPENPTVAQIRTWVRRYTASSSESQLPTSQIDQEINNFVQSTLFNAIKIDQLKTIYEFYTAPYIDTYPIDINHIQGIRPTFYVDGVPGILTKDRTEFYKSYPRFPSYFNAATGDGSTVNFTFTIGAPFLRNNVTIGTVDLNGNPLRVTDGGDGILYEAFPNSQISNPAIYPSSPAVVGLPNENTGAPGQNQFFQVGTVNYVTGEFDITFSAAPGDDEAIRVSVAQYETGRPYSLLFFNNDFIIRPVPEFVHRCEVEVYMAPVQFQQSTNTPILDQWTEYIALGVSLSILLQRQDMQGYQNLMPAFKDQEGLVLERQSVEEIGSRNSTIFSSSVPSLWGYSGYYGGWY